MWHRPIGARSWGIYWLTGTTDPLHRTRPRCQAGPGTWGCPTHIHTLTHQHTHKATHWIGWQMKVGSASSSSLCQQCPQCRRVFPCGSVSPLRPAAMLINVLIDVHYWWHTAKSGWPQTNLITLKLKCWTEVSGNESSFTKEPHLTSEQLPVSQHTQQISLPEDKYIFHQRAHISLFTWKQKVGLVFQE